MSARSVAPRSGLVIPALLVVAFLLLSGLTGSLAPRSGSTGFRPEFSSTFEIYANGTVSAPGVFSVTGNTYTLVANYAGGIEDLRNGSVLVGAGFYVDHDSGSAGVLAPNVANVTIMDFNITGLGVGIYLYSALFTDVSDTVLSDTGVSIFVDDSASTTISGVDAPATGGVVVDTSSAVTILDSDFSDSSADAIEVDASSGLTLAGDDFSHAAYSGLVAESTSGFAVDGNRFDAEGTGHGIDLEYDGLGNFSGNNLTGIAGTAEPVVVENSADIDLWDTALSGATNISYAINDSSDIQVGDSSSPDPQMEGVYLLDDSGVTLTAVDSSGEGTGVEDVDSANVAIFDSEFESGSTSIYADGATGLSVDASNLTQGNNGLVAVQSSSISVENSDLNRSNFPIYLTSGTTGVSVIDSELDRAQSNAVYLANVSDISFDRDSLEQSTGTTALIAVYAQGLTVSDSDFAGTSDDLGPEGVEEINVNASTFSDDSFAWTSSPFSAEDSTGIVLAGSDFSNASGAYAVALDQDQQVLVTGCSFVDDTGEGVNAQTVTNLTVAGSDLEGVHDDGLASTGGTDLVVSDDNFDNEEDTALFATTTVGILAYGNSMNDDSNAFFLSDGQGWTIVNNTADADSAGGLMADSATGLMIAGNNLSDQSGDMAIDVTDVNAFSVTANLLDNDSSALDVSGPAEGSVIGNEFVVDTDSMNVQGAVTLVSYHNDFIADAGWVLDTNPLAWDDGYPVGGNYWSNYTGVDQFHGPGQNLSGSDGIGDTPFVLNPIQIDRYPLMRPWTDHEATFVETGLPEGSTWVVVFNGTTYRSNATSLTVASTVGVDTAFAYSVPNVGDLAATPSSGSGELGAGVVAIHIAFAVPTYALTLNETGLPSGVFWSVTVNGTTLSGADGYVLDLPNGSYEYSVGREPGYLGSPESGIIIVSGAPKTVSVAFVPFTYTVVVTESGLPAGTHWGITVGSSTAGSGDASLTENLANGTYLFGVVAVAGYTATPGSGSWTVNGSAVNVYIAFAKNVTAPGSPNEVAGSSVLFYVLIGVLVLVAVVGWGLLLLRRRGGTPAPPPPSVPPPPPGAS